MSAIGTAVAQQLDNRRWKAMFFVCILCYTTQGFTGQSFNLFLGTITQDLGWTAAQRTMVASALSTGMIWFVFVAGMSLDKISAKKILASSALLIGILAFIRGNATGFMTFYVLMFLQGVGSAFLLPALPKMMGLWFPKNELARVHGMQASSNPLGQITANFFAVPLARAIGGWRVLFMATGVVIIILAILCFIIVKDRKSIDAALSSDQITSADDLKVWSNIKAIAKSPSYWLYVVANMFFLGMVFGGGVMGPTVLQTDPHWMLDPSVSGLPSASNNFASMICYTLIPFVLAKAGLNRYFRQIAIIAGILAPISTFIGYCSHSLIILCICFAFAGCMYGTALQAPRIMVLQLPEVSGPRAGTALGVYMTLERVAQTAFIALMGGIMAMFANQMADVIANVWLLQLMSPLCLFLAGLIEKNRSNKASV